LKQNRKRGGLLKTGIIKLKRVGSTLLTNRARILIEAEWEERWMVEYRYKVLLLY